MTDPRLILHEYIVQNKQLLDENKRYREALMFYEKPIMYFKYRSVIDGATSDIDFDKGKRARQALAGDPE